VVVLGHRSDEIRPALAGSEVEVVENPEYREGMLKSLQAGLARVPEGNWLVVALGDQPTVAANAVDRLLSAAKAETPEILVAAWEGRRGHPLLIHPTYRAEIETLDPQGGLRELLRRHPDAVRTVEVGTPEVLHDLDTPDDYQAALRRAQGA
jgi:molybdenum cofactor cytidylyltransferase